MTDHRAAFDASITFGNGGDLTVHDFRVDVPSPGVTEDEIAALFVASLGLLMTDAVELSNVRVFPEPHKGTRGGPSDRTAPTSFHGRILPLDTPATSLELPAGVGTPVASGGTSASVVGPAAVGGERSAGVEQPAVGPLGPVTGQGESSVGVERAAARGEVAAGSVTGRGEASAGEVEPADTGPEMVAGGGEPSVTREEAPDDLGAGLARTVELPAVVVRASGADWETIGVGALAPFAVRGHAVLLQTQAAECLSEAAARWLVSQAAALVATDAHTLGEPRRLLLEAGIPVAESLTGLEALPPTGAYFTAVPPHAASGATPARAYARVP